MALFILTLKAHVLPNLHQARQKSGCVAFRLEHASLGCMCTLRCLSGDVFHCSPNRKLDYTDITFISLADAFVRCEVQMRYKGKPSRVSAAAVSSTFHLTQVPQDRR